MNRQQPFLRARMMVEAIREIMGGTALSAATAAQKAQINELGQYQGRGKGKTKSHDGGGTRAAQRSAAKRRNRIKNRRAHRRPSA